MPNRHRVHLRRGVLFAPSSFSAFLLLVVCGPLVAQSNELAAKSQQARQAMTAGRFEEAATLYKELVRRLPGNPGLRMNLGLALHSAGQYRQAVKQFQIVVKKQPDSSPARLMLALAHLKLGEPEQAINPLQQILKAEPHNRVARLELADALLSVDRAEEAAGHFRKFAELDPGSPKAWQGLGLSYIALSRRAFDRLETVAPESAYAHVLLAHSLVTRNKLHTAFHLYKQAVAKDPALRGVHAAIAGIYQKMGHADWAAVEEERERQLPRPDCASHKLECEFIAGRYRQLLETVRGQETAESYYWQSRAYGELAQQAFDRLSQMPPSAAIHDLMAETYRIQGKYELSAKEWQQALKFAPQDGRLKKGLARALWLNRDFERAQPLLEELVRLEPQSVELNFQLGDALLRGETAEKAVPYLERALKFSPGYMPAHASLGRAYMRLGRAEEAIPHLKAALDLDEEGSLYYQLAQAYQKAGQQALAKQTLEKFEEISRAARARTPKFIEEYQITPP